MNDFLILMYLLRCLPRYPSGSFNIYIAGTLQKSKRVNKSSQRWDLSTWNRNTHVTCFNLGYFFNNPPDFAHDFEDSGAKSWFWDWRFWHFDFQDPLFVTQAELLRGNAKPPPLSSLMWVGFLMSPFPHPKKWHRRHETKQISSINLGVKTKKCMKQIHGSSLHPFCLPMNWKRKAKPDHPTVHELPLPELVMPSQSTSREPHFCGSMLMLMCFFSGDLPPEWVGKEKKWNIPLSGGKISPNPMMFFAVGQQKNLKLVLLFQRRNKKMWLDIKQPTL